LLAVNDSVEAGLLPRPKKQPLLWQYMNFVLLLFLDQGGENPWWLKN